MPSRYERIEAMLTSAFTPDQLEIVDESHKHAGHAGRMGVVGGETHFQVKMVAGSFAGMSRLARSRAVHDALQAEFQGGLHALSLTLQAPGGA